MDIKNYIDGYINNLNTLNEKNIEKYKYEVKKVIPQEIKEVKVYKEMKEFTDNRKKYYDKQTHFDINDQIDLFTDNNINLEEKKEFTSFFDLSVEKKIIHIKDYIKRKRYKVNCDIESSLGEILTNNDLLKKYISIDKTFNIINKISFLKKTESGDYKIVLNSGINKTKNVKYFK